MTIGVVKRIALILRTMSGEGADVGVSAGKIAAPQRLMRLDRIPPAEEGDLNALLPVSDEAHDFRDFARDAATTDPPTAIMIKAATTMPTIISMKFSLRGRSSPDGSGWF
ncbi:hypothetical protein [Nocardia sp. NPDC052566]|uniref:hypothetical protein n=1 Tax=Nocardia sp. NPDC052566 TaxID=3364330 RepID=UPI0037C76E2A